MLTYSFCYQLSAISQKILIDKIFIPMAIEALKHSAEDLSTSREAIYWTENSPKSKLNNIK
jgi:hypothetical protein